MPEVVLNDKQKQVIDELDKNILLLASAGTGKTNTLALRISNIINTQKAAAKEILCLTFTNRACKEIKDRIISIVGKEGADITVRTFHSFCFDVIKAEAKKHTDIPYDFIIYDEEDCKELIKEIITHKSNATALYRFICLIKEQSILMKSNDYKNILDYIMQYKIDKLENICVDDKYKRDVGLLDDLKQHGHQLVDVYNKTLYERHGLDFHDLLIQVNELFEREEVASRWNKKFKFIHVDEVQDTSEIEYNMISKLFTNNRVMLCGDYFQTIYEWRGSKPKNVFNLFTNEYSPLFIAFNKNYRSTQSLLKASRQYLINAFGTEVDCFHNDPIKISSHEKGQSIQLKNAESLQSEADWIFNKIKQLNVTDLSKVAILTRNNTINTALSNVFYEKNSKLKEQERLHFLLVDDFKFFRRQEIKDIVAYLKLIINKFDSNSLHRIIHRFAQGIGNKALEHIESKSARQIGVRLTDFVDMNTLRHFEPFQLLFNELEKRNVIVFDVETTGVNVTADEIVQIAAIKIDADGRIIEKFERLLKPTKKVEDSFFVHGFSDELLQTQGEDTRCVLQQFSHFIKNALIVGHNVSFDLNILHSQLSRLSLEAPNYIDYYDTLDIARRFYPRLVNHKLETLSKQFNTTTKSSHNALNDVLATAEVLICMINQKIKPTTFHRTSFYQQYISKFTQLCNDIHLLRTQSLNIRPFELIEQIISISNMIDTYQDDPQRIENIKEFYNIARSMDNIALSSTDSLMELIKTAALTNGELDRMIEQYPRIPIITVHQAKGLEFDYVFLAGLQEYTFPSYLAIKENSLDEEKRVFYVALTRAKKQLFLSWSKKDQYNREKKISRFTKDIPSELIEVV